MTLPPPNCDDSTASKSADVRHNFTDLLDLNAKITCLRGVTGFLMKMLVDQYI